MTKLSVAALIGHADDFSMLEACIAHVRLIGIEAICVTADADAVGGDEGLRALAERGDVRVVFHRKPVTESNYFLRETAMETARWADADFVLFLDSDETPLASGPGFATIPELHEADVVTFKRTNALHPAGGLVPLVPEDLRETLVVARSQHIDLSDSNVDGTPWILSQIMPRSMFARDVLKHLAFGAHTIVRDDVRTMASGSLLFVHHAVTSYERFERKIRRIQEMLAMQPDKFKAGQASHWKRWVALYESGRLREEFARQILSDDDLARLRREGIVASADEVLRASS